MFRPSSGCPKNLLSDYTVCVVVLEVGRDHVLQHKSCVGLAKVEINLLMGYINVNIL